MKKRQSVLGCNALAEDIMFETDDPDMFIGMKLREKRKKSGFTIAEIAEKIGVSMQLIQKYEQGRARIPAGALYRMAVSLGASPADFFEGLNQGRRPRNAENVLTPVDKDTPLYILLLAEDPGEELIVREAIEKSAVKTSVFCLHDDRQALDFLRGRTSVSFPHPDIILAENHPARQYGFNLLREVKRDRELSVLPVILFTSNPSASEAEKIYRAGVSGYIYRSLNPGGLDMQIRKTLEYWAEACALPSRNGKQTSGTPSA